MDPDKSLISDRDLVLAREAVSLSASLGRQLAKDPGLAARVFANFENIKKYIDKITTNPHLSIEDATDVAFHCGRIISEYERAERYVRETTSPFWETQYSGLLAQALANIRMHKRAIEFYLPEEE